MTQRAYPLDNTEYYAEDVRLFHVARTPGIFNATGTDLQVSAAGGMKLSVLPGYAYLLTSDSTVGGITYGSSAIETINAEVASSTARYDYISVRYDKLANECKLKYTRGTDDYPTPVRNANSYEIILALIHVRDSATEIKNSDITDTRLDENYCGLVIDGTERIPTEGMQKQFQDFMNGNQTALDELSKGIFPMTNEDIDEVTS